MARRVSEHPTELELAVLRIIWREGPCTVRQICDALVPDRRIAFTSTLTIMNIMVKKGYLEAKRRSRADGGTLYKAKVGESRTALSMLQSLARRLYDGSITTAIQNLVRAGEIDRSELAELRKLVNDQAEDPPK